MTLSLCVYTAVPVNFTPGFVYIEPDLIVKSDWYSARMCTTTSTLLLVLLAVGFGHATEYGRTLADPGNGEIIPLDVALDNESMIVYPGTPDPPQECFKQSVNLHDFNRGLVAIKIVDRRVCYIKQSSETYQEVAKSLHLKDPVKQVTEEWAFGKEVIQPEVVRTRFGSLIANFCTGYDVSEMEEGHLLNAVARRSQGDKNSVHIHIGCIFCWGKRRV